MGVQMQGQFANLNGLLWSPNICQRITHITEKISMVWAEGPSPFITGYRLFRFSSPKMDQTQRPMTLGVSRVQCCCCDRSIKRFGKHSGWVRRLVPPEAQNFCPCQPEISACVSRVHLDGFDE